MANLTQKHGNSELLFLTEQIHVQSSNKDTLAQRL